MLEAAVAVSIAIATGVGAVMSKQQQRLFDLDKRMDEIALRVAERYITKMELADVVRKMEGHMIRIEDKLDRIANAR
jgi:uncharacterized coiled-coil protein SlyX|tara:strand:+ start:955 stop:1185 length:231 start_codon:yes stop_codon:yes gene_type:complete